MGNRGRGREGGTRTQEHAVGAASAAAGDLVAPPICGGADLDAYIQELVDAAPPLTAEQRDTLALLLRRPRRR